MNEQKLHFIIGIGRSGTTILTKLLNKYKDVHCLPEANFLVFFLQKFKGKKTFSKSEITQIFEEIDLYALSHPWVGWEFNLQQTKNDILDIVSINNTITYPNLCKAIYEKFYVTGFDKSKAKILIDKNPSYTIFANEISQVFPESKFIWIVRDYRANVLSRKQSVFLKSPNISYNATRWRLYNERANSFYQKNNDKTILIKYEDLLLNNAQVVENLVRFLNISPVLETTNFEEKQHINLDNFKIADKFKDRFTKKYSDLNKTLNTDRLSVWKEQLSETEIKQCDAICSPFALELGYDPRFHLTRSEKIKLKITYLKPILLGYFDIFKDKLLYYAPIELKLNRLKKKYITLGFIKK